MMIEKTKSIPRKKPQVGEHGAFYVSVVNKQTGWRDTYGNLETEAETLKIAEDKSDDEHNTHPYRFDREEGIYVKIPINEK